MAFSGVEEIFKEDYLAIKEKQVLEAWGPFLESPGKVSGP